MILHVLSDHDTCLETDIKNTLFIISILKYKWRKLKFTRNMPEVFSEKEGNKD